MSSPRQSPAMFLLDLHGKLLRARKAQGLTQAEVARRLGITRSTFHRWEVSKNDPSVTQAVRWARAVGVEITATESGTCAASVAA